jgi:cyclopropane fatty-acyl-phospholipid synthase-like methyltransferase
MVDDINKVRLQTQQRWNALHKEAKHQLKYPSETVIRFVSNCWPQGSREGIKLLDLGCGAGRHAIALAAEGFDVYATDISNEGLKYTKSQLRRLGLIANVGKARMSDQPFPDNFFDGVIAYGVLYYDTVEMFEETVNEIYRILKDNGQALIVTRTTRDRRFGMGKQLDWNTYLIERPDTNEAGMTMCFLTYNDVVRIFENFSQGNIERIETTTNDLTEKDSNWIIAVRK